MLIQLFSKWKVDQLKTFLNKRGVVLSGGKVELAEKAYYTWKLEVAKTTLEEEDDASMRQREKLTIELIVSLPFPSSLKVGWEEGSLNFSKVLEDEVEAYMQPPAKAMKQGKSLLSSEHIIHSVKFHRISTDVKYCSFGKHPIRYKLGSGSVLWVWQH